MTVLVTGGAGYIGSHTVVALLQAGQDVVVVDNFCNSHPIVLERIATIAGRAPLFYELDERDGALPLDAKVVDVGERVVQRGF